MSDQFSLRDRKEMVAAISLAGEREKDMNDLINSADKMGFLSKLYDSKVPSEKKWLFHLFSLKLSDPKVIKEEIVPHRDFYNKLKEALEKVTKGTEDANDLLEVLSNTFYEIVEEDKSKKKTTNSSKLHSLYSEFTAERNVVKLENMIRRGQTLASNQKIKRLENNYAQAVEDICQIREDLTQARDENKLLLQRFGQLMDLNTVMLNQQQQLIQEQQDIRNEVRDQRRVVDLLQVLVDEIRRDRGGSG